MGVLSMHLSEGPCIYLRRSEGLVEINRLKRLEKGAGSIVKEL